MYIFSLCLFWLCYSSWHDTEDACVLFTYFLKGCFIVTGAIPSVYDCPSTSEATWKVKGKICQYLFITKHNKVQNMGMISEMYFTNAPGGFLCLSHGSLMDPLKHSTGTGIILCMCLANERWHYIVTSSLIGWAHTQNDPCTNLHHKQ